MGWLPVHIEIYVHKNSRQYNSVFHGVGVLKSQIGLINADRSLSNYVNSSQAQIFLNKKKRISQAMTTRP